MRLKRESMFQLTLVVFLQNFFIGADCHSKHHQKVMMKIKRITEITKNIIP